MALEAGSVRRFDGISVIAVRPAAESMVDSRCVDEKPALNHIGLQTRVRAARYLLRNYVTPPWS
jgi:hypothetical protein